MLANKAIILARKHIGNGAVMDSSARACLENAIEQYDAGNYDSALMWATKSLAYSVGVFHADYRKALFWDELRSRINRGNITPDTLTASQR